MRCGTSRSTATRTSSRSTSPACAARSTTRSTRRSSRLFAAPATGSRRPVADGAVPRVSRGLFTSTRLRVTAAATFAVVVVLVGAGIVLVRVQHAQLVDRVDEANVQRRSEIATDLQGGRTGAINELRGADVVAQVIDAEGRIVVESSDLRGDRLVTGTRTFDGV